MKFDSYQLTLECHLQSTLKREDNKQLISVKPHANF